MFDIDAAHISDLNDTDLRTLIARLCEAELRRHGLPVSGVTYGGNQNAPDGGLDVRVSIPLTTTINGFIPKPTTGFQVKVPDMPRGAIIKEMCPNDVLRPVIRQLASESGAYIIVSGRGSTSDSSLQGRKDAMREALAALEDPSMLTVDFYDRERVASWVRDYSGLVAWVRERIGQPIRGWRTYGSWSAPNDTVEASYLLDTQNRIRDGRSAQEDSLPIEEGIHRIRTILARPRRAVRVIGLSGTGKTRLVQAIFDARVGTHALDPALAVYTDLADDPDPPPRDLLLRLTQNRRRAIIIVDNCPPEIHRALTSLCTANESDLSLITVEYDVGDDEPEATDVFRLGPASVAVIDSLLRCQAPHISQVDRAHIAQLSGGNARIALALARTVDRGESITNLRDTDLFNRLFYQRQALDEYLLRAAEVCSLVYSFNGETLQGEFAELPFLAQLAGLTTDQLHRSISELHSRDLVQRRGPWRAVLPQPLADRLARRALERLPMEKLLSMMSEEAPERVLRSFSRRLGYLHESQEAQSIVRVWLSERGLLFDISQLNSLGIAMFQNIAPVNPKATLETLERAANDDDSKCLNPSQEGHDTWISLLRSLAYQPDLFERVALLLARFIINENSSGTQIRVDEQFKELFHIQLSGTHAALDRRLRVIDTLMKTEDPKHRRCGCDALEALLKASHFSSSHHFQFGAHSRDYGWFPKTRDDVVAWYRPSIDYAKRLAVMQNVLGKEARIILAKCFRGLWTKASMVDELESTVLAVAEKGFWSEGWVAVRNTIAFDADKISNEHLIRLRALEVPLRPRDLFEKIQAYVLKQHYGALDIENGELSEHGMLQTKITGVQTKSPRS